MLVLLTINVGMLGLVMSVGCALCVVTCLLMCSRRASLHAFPSPSEACRACTFKWAFDFTHATRTIHNHARYSANEPLPLGPTPEHA